MTAWTWFEGASSRVGSWRLRWAFWQLVLVRLGRPVIGGYYIIMTVLLALGLALIAAAPAVTQSSSAVDGRRLERKVESMERELWERSKDVAVLEEQVLQNTEYHRRLDALNVSERLTQMESNQSIMTKLLMLVLATLLPITIDTAKRLLGGAKK